MDIQSFSMNHSTDPEKLYPNQQTRQLIISFFLLYLRKHDFLFNPESSIV